MVLAVTLWASVAGAADCPVAFDKVDDGLAATRTCKAARTIFFACLRGSSADLEGEAVVRARCEPDFLPTLNPRERKAYQDIIRVCKRKHEQEDGTMYRAFETECAARVVSRH